MRAAINQTGRGVIPGESLKLNLESDSNLKFQWSTSNQQIENDYEGILEVHSLGSLKRIEISSSHLKQDGSVLIPLKNNLCVV